MADMIYSARRRKLAAAEAAGDVQRMTILRGMMTPPAVEKAPTEVDVPEEATPQPDLSAYDTTVGSWNATLRPTWDE